MTWCNQLQDVANPMTHIEETLSSSYRGYAILGLSAIAVVFGGFGVWAATAPLDSAAIAPGRVSVESSTKPVQHLEGGLLQEVLVKESETVARGQVLFRLQSTEAKAKADLLQKQIDSNLAVAARLMAEQTGAVRVSFPGQLEDRRNDAVARAAMEDQIRIFSDRRDLLESRLAVLASRKAQVEGQMRGVGHRIASLEQLVTSYEKEIAGLTEITAKGFYPKNKLAAKQREHDRAAGELGYLKGDVARQTEALAEIANQRNQLIREQQEEVSSKLSETRMKLSDLKEQLTVARDKLARIEVRSPQAGVVQNIQMSAIGAVVRPGDTLAEVVPVTDEMVISAHVNPADIDRVHPGLTAEVRFTNFSMARTPTVLGKVQRVSADTLIHEVTREPYYEARIVIDRATISEDLASNLVPGMPADVIVSTGERTMLQYLLTPITDAIARSMRER